MEPYRNDRQRVGETVSSAWTGPHERRRPPVHLKQMAGWSSVSSRAASLVLCLSVIGVLAHTLIIYHETAMEWFKWPHGSTIRAWPQPNANLIPTYLVLAAAATAAVANLLALIAILRKVRNKSMYQWS
jgi:hypothetical protein